jgi:hypothetical protein
MMAKLLLKSSCANAAGATVPNTDIAAIKADVFAVIIVSLTHSYLL